jgi:hypothetical protein
MPECSPRSEDGTIRLWPLTPGLTRPSTIIRTGQVLSVTFGTLGGFLLLASGAADGTVQMWNPARGTKFGPPLTGHIGRVNSVAFATDRPGRRRVRDGPLVPVGARQQVLQPVRTGVADRFSQRPAVHVLQFHQQAPGHLPESDARLAGKAAGQSAEQALGQLPVPDMRYRWRGGRRVLNLSHIWS